MNDKARKLRIDIYDDTGDLVEVVEAEYTFEQLSQELTHIIGEDGIPVLREIREEKEPVPSEWKPGMGIRYKVAGVEFSCDGQPEQVKEMYERFLEGLPDLMKLVYEEE